MGGAIRFYSLKILALLCVLPLSGSAVEKNEVNCPPPRLKQSSWKAHVFAGSAFLAVATGIAIICLDGGTSNEATQRLKGK